MTPANALLLGQLAAALTRLERVLRAEAEAAQDVAGLSIEAEQIAFVARDLAGFGRAQPPSAAALCERLGGFLNEAAGLASLARDAAALSTLASEKLHGHCEGLRQIASGSVDAAASTVLRAELSEMTETIETIKDGQQAAEGLGAHISALATSALELSVLERQLRTARHPAAEIGVELSRRLRGFASQAALLSDALARHAVATKAAIARASLRGLIADVRQGERRLDPEALVGPGAGVLRW
jgi:hypothetical protein